ncbi:hypothetical protein [Sulfuricurvum sp.]|uniref:hypothetical protein n=1 Tax=Sulfuricurvum sp. TaxID=2025608 RepID=UPI003BB50B80
MLNIKAISILMIAPLTLLVTGCVNQPRPVVMENLKVVNGKYYRQSVNPSPMIPMPIRIGETYQCTIGNETGILSLISSEKWIYEDKEEKQIFSKATGIYSNRMQGVSKNGQIFYIAMAKEDNTKLVVTDGKQHFLLPCVQISNNAYALSEQQAQLYMQNQQMAQQQAMHDEQIRQQKSAQSSREWDAILDRQNETFNTLYKTSNDNINSYQTPINTNSYDYSFKSNEPKVYILTK